jgi:hypothetical protein
MFKGLIALAALCLPVAAHASTVSPTGYSYTAPPSGPFAYFNGPRAYLDDTYDASTGTGELTDGTSANLYWESTDGFGATGPNVGWKDDDPVIVFTFAEVISFGSMVMNFQDGAGIFGVGKPDSVIVNGFQPPNITEGAGGVQNGKGPYDTTIDLTSLAPTDQLTVTVVNNSFAWTMLSEFTFTEATVAPVPILASGLLLVAGLGAVALGRRRRL